MKALIFASIASLALATGAGAQTADKKAVPGDAPTKSMDAATPEMKGPGTGEHPPTGRMDQAVPPMKSGDAATTTGTNGQADCEAAWTKANPSNAATITEAQAQQYVADVRAANPDNDGTLDKTEFTKACESGLVAK